MKKLLIIIALLVLNSSVFAQAPEKFKYQAIITDNKDKPIKKKTIGLEISIMQNDVNGILSYQEAFTPTTNNSGMVSLEIGTGNATSGSFSEIDWSVGPYFLSVAVDKNGGTNYTFMGASQLLSVPYALYAKTAGTITESQTLADVVTLGNTANSQLKNVTDPTEAQDATTKAYVDDLITDLTARIRFLETGGPAAIGDLRAGGVVFWVNPTDNTHGLVCALEDQTSNPGGLVFWSNDTDIPTGAIGTTIGTGSANTDAIIATQGSTAINYAAGLARSFRGGGYNDWFLPSKDELNEIHLNRLSLLRSFFDNGGNLFEGFYWSSTQSDSGGAWVQLFSSNQESAEFDGEQAVFQNAQISVRAVRAF